MIRIFLVIKNTSYLNFSAHINGKRIHVLHFWEDIIDFLIIRAFKKLLLPSTFLGTTILYTETPETPLKVIDRQQRLTTLTPVLKALLKNSGTYTALFDNLQSRHLKDGYHLLEIKVTSKVFEEDNNSLKDIILGTA